MAKLLTQPLKGTLLLPGDKSISHRALMFLSLCQGEATISNLSNGQDVLSTLGCLQALGCDIKTLGENTYRIKGHSRFNQPEAHLDCGNSGTTIRLMSGLLAGANISAVLTGDESLCKRPMKRILDPLHQMGASIEALGELGKAPLKIQPTPTGLHRIDYSIPMASAQVKSAILLAGLFTPTSESIQVQEPLPSRDHTERMLSALGATIQKEGSHILLLGRQGDLVAQDIHVPGDISSAAFWLVGAAILPGSQLTLKQVSLNPSRLEILNVLQSVGLDITVRNVQDTAGEPYADLVIESDLLTGDIHITPEQVPAVIDEIPVLTILGLFNDGQFSVRGAEELRFKESDRLGSLIEILKKLKVEVTVFEDGFTFQGNPNWQVPLIETAFETHHDHRLVMALEILNLRASHPLPIAGQSWVAISYPAFYATLAMLQTSD